MSNKAHHRAELLAHLPTIQDKWANVSIDEETHWATIGQEWHWETLSDPVPTESYVLTLEELRHWLMDGLAGKVRGQVDVHRDRYVYTLRFGEGEYEIHRTHHWMLDETHALHTVVCFGNPCEPGYFERTRRYRCVGVTA